MDHGITGFRQAAPVLAKASSGLACSLSRPPSQTSSQCGGGLSLFGWPLPKLSGPRWSGGASSYSRQIQEKMPSSSCPLNHKDSRMPPARISRAASLIATRMEPRLTEISLLGNLQDLDGVDVRDRRLLLLVNLALLAPERLVEALPLLGGRLPLHNLGIQSPERVFNALF